MKKTLMILGAVSLSFLLSDLSFAHKHKHAKENVVTGTTKAVGKTAVGATEAVGKTAVGVTKAVLSPFSH